MNEHTSIPVPGGKPEGAKNGSSLLERAAGKDTLNAFLAPPVPVDLVPEKPKRPVRKAEPAPVEAEEFRDPELGPFARPAAKVEPESVEVPTVAEPVPAHDPEPVLAEPEPDPEPVVEPARFDETRHPVDRDCLREQGFIVPEGKVTALLEEFRIVKRQLLLNSSDLRRQGSGPEAQRILVSSPHPDEGKTYCALNLALSIAAEKESEVLLVDADFAKPSILSALDLPAGPGLMDALADPTADVAEFVIGTDIPGLWVLPAGNTTNSDTEFLSSSRTRTVLDRLTQGAPHRIVLFDSPPALAASPAAELAKYVAQAVMVVRADKTGQGSLEDALSLLSACPNIQLLLNAVHFSPSGRKFGTYYGYGG